MKYVGSGIHETLLPTVTGFCLSASGFRMGSAESQEESLKFSYRELVNCESSKDGFCPKPLYNFSLNEFAKALSGL